MGSSLCFLKDFQNNFKSCLPLLNIVKWVPGLVTRVKDTSEYTQSIKMLPKNDTWRHIYVPSSFCALGSLSHIDKIFLKNSVYLKSKNRANIQINTQ